MKIKEIKDLIVDPAERRERSEKIGLAIGGNIKTKEERNNKFEKGNKSRVAA